MKDSRTPLLFALVALPLAALVLRFDFLCDDAFISYRYARHLAAGEGLRFNLGVEPPVEGYTNLLWILWCTPFEWLRLDVGLASRLSSAVLAFALLGLVVRLTARRAPTAPRAWLAPLAGGLFLALSPAFATWATSGLETMAFSFCVFLGFERLLLEPDRPRAWQAGLALAAAALLRADGVVPSASVLAAVLFVARLGRRPELARAVLRASALVVLAVLLQETFRVLYHGDLLPYTAHAKVSFGSAITLERGGRYVAHFLLLFPAVLLAPLLAFARRGPAPAWRQFALAAAVPFAAVYLWSFAVGGDYMAFGRFLVPALPFAACLFACAAMPTAERALAPLRVAALALLLGTQLLPAFEQSAVPRSALAATNFRLHKDYESQVAAWRGLAKGVERGREKGELLAELVRPGDSLVAGAVGAQAYYSDVFVYDRLGLVTREVAHRDVEHSARAAGHDKGVPATFFLKDRPTIMHLDLVQARVGKQFTVPSELAAEYVARSVPVGEGLVLRLIVRRDSHLADL